MYIHAFPFVCRWVLDHQTFNSDEFWSLNSSHNSCCPFSQLRARVSLSACISSVLDRNFLYLISLRSSLCVEHYRILNHLISSSFSPEIAPEQSLSKLPWYSVRSANCDARVSLSACISSILDRNFLYLISLRSSLCVEHYRILNHLISSSFSPEIAPEQSLSKLPWYSVRSANCDARVSLSACISSILDRNFLYLIS